MCRFLGLDFRYSEPISDVDSTLDIFNEDTRVDERFCRIFLDPMVHNVCLVRRGIIGICKRELDRYGTAWSRHQYSSERLQCCPFFLTFKTPQ